MPPWRALERHIKRVTGKTSDTRNRLMAELADNITIGYASKNGLIEKLISEVRGKPIHRIVWNFWVLVGIEAGLEINEFALI